MEKIIMHDLLTQLELTKLKLGEIQPLVDQYAGEIAELKEAIAKKMTENGIKTVLTPHNKFMVTIATRRDIRIADEPTVRTYLQSNGLLEECIRLDLATVKRYAKAQSIPGMEEVETEVTTVREVKDKVEEVQAEETDAEFRKRIREEV